MTLIRSVLDLTTDEIDWVLDRADRRRSGPTPSMLGPGTVIGLAFLETSLRTQVGFAAAAARLAAAAVEVPRVRASETSMPESVDDTLRVLAGYTDVIVARVDRPLTRLPDGIGIPVLNGGDRGGAAEHPSQALIDLFALRRLPGDLDQLGVAVCGDLRMRSVRSLLLLLERYRPGKLVLVTEEPLTDGFTLPKGLVPVTEYRTLSDLADVDVIYLAGIPHGALSEEGRTRLRVTAQHLDALPAHAALLSPLPVIDEIERAAVTHPRVRMFEQSDDGLYVRMAALELLLAAGRM